MDAKTIRKQLRNIVQELLPEALLAGIKEDVIKEVKESYFEPRLRKIEANIKESLEMLDQRSKDSLGYLVRQVSEPGLPQPLAPKEAPAVDEGD